jgi:mono/diheme cytochrome c family protein
MTHGAARFVTFCITAAMMSALSLSAASAADAAKPAAPAAKPATAAKPAPAAPAAAGGAMPTNIWDGIYTNAQAKRGDVLYAQHCAMCHMVDMGGKEPAPELAGDNFLSKWLGLNVGELYERVATTMPAGNPGVLSPAEYADVVAVMLQANNFKAGKIEMKGDPAALKKIVIKKKGS